MELLIKDLTLYLLKNDNSKLTVRQIIKQWQIDNHITFTKDTDVKMLFAYCEQFKNENKELISIILQQI